MDEYDPIKLAQDATVFADSDFGKHYLARLQMLKDHNLSLTMSDAFTESQRAHAGSRADVYDKEIGYFNAARTINTDKKLSDRVRENFRRRTKKK